jgi:hypothetical protein
MNGDAFQAPHLRKIFSHPDTLPKTPPILISFTLQVFCVSLQTAHRNYCEVHKRHLWLLLRRKFVERVIFTRVAEDGKRITMLHYTSPTQKHYSKLFRD